MTYISIFTIALVAGTVLRLAASSSSKPWLGLASWSAFAVAVLMAASSSFLVVDQDAIGHLKRVYLAKNMQPGQIIALDDELGPQARILGPGFHFIPAVRLLYTVDQFPVVDVPQGSFGLLTARDGAPLKAGQFMAEGWDETALIEMLNAEHFLSNGGQKGPQLSVLRPGRYRHGTTTQRRSRQCDCRYRRRLSRAA